MFEFEGTEFTEEQVQAFADDAGVPLKEYTEKYGFNPGKTQPTTQKGAEPVDVMQAPELTLTESPSVDTSLDLQEISNEEKRKLPYLVRNKISTAGKPFTKDNVEAELQNFKAIQERPISEAIKKDIEAGKKDLNIAKQSFSNRLYNFLGDEESTPFSLAMEAAPIYGSGIERIARSPRLQSAIAGIAYTAADLIDEIGVDLKETKKAAISADVDAKERMKKTTGLTSASGPFSFLEAILGAGMETGYSVATGAATAGTMPLAELAGNIVADYNLTKAKTKYPDISEEEAVYKLIEEKETEVWTPMAFAVPAIILERAGLKGVKTAMLLKGSTKQIAKGLWLEGNKEGRTEYLQGALEKISQSVAQGKDTVETAVDAVDYLVSKEGLENYLQGLVGTGVLTGGSNLTRNIVNGNLSARYEIDGDKLNTLTDEIVELNQKLAETKSNTVKESLLKQIKQKEEDLSSLVVKANGIINLFSDKDYKDINDLEKLKQQQIANVKKLSKEFSDGLLNEEERADGLNLLKQEYLNAQNRIKGIVKNVSDKSNKAAQEVQKLYDKKADGYEGGIIELYRPMAEKIAKKRQNVPGFDKQLLVDQILTGERGVLDLVRSYRPEDNPGVPLPAYINTFIGRRAIEATKKTVKEGFDLDVTEAKGVTDTTTEEITEQVDAPTEVQKLLSNELKLSDETSSRVLQAVEKTLGTKLPAVDSKDFKKKLRTGLRNELVNVFKQEAGKGAKYNEFISDVYDKLLPLIPQETLNRKLPFAVEPVLDPETGKQKREKTKEGKKIFKRKGIPKAEFIKYFTDTSLKGNVKGARKTSLAEILADEIGMDKVLPVLSKPEVLEKFTAVQELQGQQVPKDIPKAIASVIDRLDQFIAAAKEFENDRSILRSDFGFGNVVVKGLRVFAEATKAALNTGVSVANAIKQGVQAFKQYLFNSGLTEADIEDISSAIDNINESDLKLDPESLGNKIIDSAEKNSKTAIKNWLTESLKNISDPFELAEFLELNLTAFRNTYKKGDGFNLNTNDQVLDYIKDLIPKELYKLIDLKNRRPISVRQAQSAKFMQAFFKDESGFIEKQHEQAEYMRELVTKQVNKFKIAYKESKDESVLKNAHRWFQMQNSYMDTPFRLSQKIRLIVRGDFSKYVLEHNFPGKDQVRLYMNYIAGDIDYNSLSKALDNATLDLMPKELEYIYNIDEGMFHTMGKDFDYIKNDPKGKRYSETYLSELKKINGTITDLNSVSKKQKKDLDTQFNQLIQATTGVEYYKTYSPAKARLVGRGKGKRKFFIPYSADDFVGLLYATLGEGKVGDKQMAWYEENLLRPFSRGIQRYEVAKQKAMREWMALSSQIKKDVPGGLNKRNDTGFRNQDSLRMYIWAKQGMDVPGAAKSDVSDAVALVSNNPKLKEFAERLIALNPDGYPAPGQSWDAGDITTDIVSYVNDVRRGEFLTEWKQNVDQIFTDKNKQKLLASYGQNYIDALEDILHRMKTGRNRKFGVTKAERAFMDWTNNSVGAIMFFNARSAVLQTLSAVNFINFSDNNPINAGLAFANQPQYWKDFSALFNSDFLKQRRSGLQTDVNADEIANAAKSSSNKAKAALSAILKLGFTPTQIADSFAIASGGATFYRNRVKKYIKDGLDKEAAEKKAFTDFQEVAEETQQSARPDRISSQQASSLGRLVLAFGNTPMQYARLTKKATLDLVNGRGDWKTNISKIAYYSVIQNIIFSSLQQGLFALLFDEEDDEKEKSRYFRIGNSSFDTLLRGAGVYGAAAATVKNMVLEIIEQSEKSRPDYTKVAMEATALSPPINSKLRKLESAGKTFTYKQSKEKVFTEGFSFENPGFLAAGKTISALTNLPADRVVQKADHIHTAMQDETELWQSIALSLGWSEWDLNMIEKKTKGSATPTRRSRTRTRNRTRSRKRN